MRVSEKEKDKKRTGRERREGDNSRATDSLEVQSLTRVIIISLSFTGKDYGISTLHYNWPMSAHASQALKTYTSARD